MADRDRTSRPSSDQRDDRNSSSSSNDMDQSTRDMNDRSQNASDRNRTDRSGADRTDRDVPSDLTPRTDDLANDESTGMRGRNTGRASDDGVR